MVFQFACKNSSANSIQSFNMSKISKSSTIPTKKVSRSNIRDEANTTLWHRHHGPLGGHTVPGDIQMIESVFVISLLSEDLRAPAINRDATAAAHGNAIHDRDIGHRQFVDRQVQGILLLQVGGLRYGVRHSKMHCNHRQ